MLGRITNDAAGSLKTSCQTSGGASCPMPLEQHSGFLGCRRRIEDHYDPLSILVHLIIIVVGEVDGLVLLFSAHGVVVNDLCLFKFFYTRQW